MSVAPRPALARKLTTRDLVVNGLLFIGPLAPVGVFGVLDARAGGAVAAVYVAATVAMGFTAWAYAQMSRAVPHAGSVFAYATEGIGPRAGFLAGWMALLDYLLIPSVALLFSGLALHSIFPAIPTWAFVATAFLVTTAVNLVGVGVAARVGLIVLIAEIVVFGVLVVAVGVVLWTHGPARPWLSPLVGTAGFDTSAVVSAISVAVLSYLGFDAIANFAEEHGGDARQVGWAIQFCLVIAGVLFVAQTWLAGVLAPFSPAELAATPVRQGTAFYEVVRTAIVPWLATLLAITKAIGPIFSAMVAQAASARLLYGMARDGGLPARLADIDTHSHVPRAAVLTTAALTLLVSLWAARLDNGLSLLVSIVDVGALTAFTLLHVAVIGYFVIRRRAAATAAHILWPVAGIIVTTWVIVEASSLAQDVGLAWAALGLIVTAVRASRL